MAQLLDARTRLYRACPPDEWLKPPDDRYVNCDEARGANVVAIYEECLRLATPEKPEIKLFTGHLGVGKTSELFRLKAKLEHAPTAEKPSTFQVVYFDVGDALDVNDLDFPDLLVSIAAEVQQQLLAANVPGLDPVTGRLQRLWDDVKNALGSNLAVKDAKVKVPFVELTAEFKSRPNARHELRAAIEMRGNDLLGAVNDLLTDATVRLQEAGKDGLVLIVDGLDKLVFRELKDGKTNTHDRLFVDRSDQLASLKAHTIYTAPISLLYSARTARLNQAFGEFSVPVSMIDLRGDKKSDPTPETVGMKAMWRMIEARCRHANVNIDEVFDAPATAHYLCRMTGGHPRHLMMFLRSAILAVARLPITRQAAETAVRKYEDTLLRQIPDAYWEKLREFATPQTKIPKDEMHQEMLYLLHIFEYTNGHPWYEVNPVIRNLPQFAAGP